MRSLCLNAKDQFASALVDKKADDELATAAAANVVLFPEIWTFITSL
jgi:hypothetical protein